MHKKNSPAKKIMLLWHVTAEKKYRRFAEMEKELSTFLESNSFYVVRLDGVKMAKSFRSDDYSRIHDFDYVMNDTVSELMKFSSKLGFAYRFSDEISILLNGNKDSHFMNRIEKILSIIPSKASAIFNNHLRKEPNLCKKEPIFCFDCRILKFDNISLVNDYFAARQNFAVYLHAQNIAIQHHIETRKMSVGDIVKELGNLCNPIDYNVIPLGVRNGYIFYRNGREIQKFEAELFCTNKYLKTLDDIAKSKSDEKA